MPTLRPCRFSLRQFNKAINKWEDGPMQPGWYHGHVMEGSSGDFITLALVETKERRLHTIDLTKLEFDYQPQSEPWPTRNKNFP